MSGYKLVPIEPTKEMIDAGGMAVSSFPKDVLDQYQAMLAAAPVVEQEPVAWVSPKGLSRLSPDSPVNYALVHKRSNNETLPLYAHPQPAPNVSQLVEALEQCITSMLDSGYSKNSVVIRAGKQALAAYRNGGDV